MHSKRFFFFLSAASLLLSMLGVFVVNAMSGLEDDKSAGGKIKFYKYTSQLGADGYDVVAYFDSSDAVKGEPVYEANFGGLAWHFSSEENRDKFIADPGSYLPQYGGHCAYAVANGYLAFGDPQAWSIRDGKLYLNYNKSIRSAWLADVDNYLRLSENNWPQLNK